MAQGKLDYEALTNGLATKSEKIRTLARKGVPTAEIARFLGIRYQHARNVLVDAGLHGEAREEQQSGFQEDLPRDLETKMMPVPPPASAPANQWLRLAEDGSLLIPPMMLASLGLKPSESVRLMRQGDHLELMSRQESIKRAWAITAKYKRPGVDEVEEFIKEKRAEAKREEESWS